MGNRLAPHRHGRGLPQSGAGGFQQQTVKAPFFRPWFAQPRKGRLRRRHTSSNSASTARAALPGSGALAVSAGAAGSVAGGVNTGGSMKGPSGVSLLGRSEPTSIGSLLPPWPGVVPGNSGPMGSPAGASGTVPLPTVGAAGSVSGFTAGPAAGERGASTVTPELVAIPAGWPRPAKASACKGAAVSAWAAAGASGRVAGGGAPLPARLTAWSIRSSAETNAVSSTSGAGSLSSTGA